MWLPISPPARWAVTSAPLVTLVTTTVSSANAASPALTHSVRDSHAANTHVLSMTRSRTTAPRSM